MIQTTIPFNKYIVWQCTHCGKWNGKQNNKWSPSMTERGKMYAIEKLTLNCKKCNKSIKMKNKLGGGVRTKHFWFNHPMDATRKIQQEEEIIGIGKMKN